MILSSLPNAFGQIFQTLAQQNERSGLITMLAYVGLAYSFLGDIFIVKVTFSYTQLGIVLLLLLTNLTVVASGMRK